MNLSTIARALGMSEPTTPVVTATPEPIILDKPAPPGTVRLGGFLYRLPRASDPEGAAHDLRVLAEAFGTPTEMRQFGVPEDVIARHLPKPEAPEAPEAQSPVAETWAIEPAWPNRSTALAPGARPVAGSRVHLWDEVGGKCQPAVVQRVADHYAPAGAKPGSPDAYLMAQALRVGGRSADRPRWARYAARPVALANASNGLMVDQVWSWHRATDHSR